MSGDLGTPLLWPAFTVKVPGKWLLTGEHSVIRGAQAITMPNTEFGLSLSYEPNEPVDKFQIDPVGIRLVVQDAFHLGKLDLPRRGKLTIKSSIPVGAGMGSSAALCVAVTRWISDAAKLSISEWPAFATQLENRFHGKSSGADVAAVCAGEALSFVRGKPAVKLGLSKIPKFSFHDTDLRANTHACVAQVEAYLVEQPEAGQAADARMAQASELAVLGLRKFDQGESAIGLEYLVKAMTLAHESFLEWNLVPEQAVSLRKKLLSEGALAAKLTGAGNGGMMIALWP